MPLDSPLAMSEVTFLQPGTEHTSVKIREVNTVAFLPTAGIFRDSEGMYLLENKWSGREDLNLRPPGPEPDSRVYWILKEFVCGE